MDEKYYGKLRAKEACSQDHSYNLIIKFQYGGQEI